MAAVGRPSKRNGLVNLLEKGMRIAARRLGDERFMLTREEKDDLSDAMNEFSRYHNIPVMSPAWAARIGLATALGAIAAARVEIFATPRQSGAHPSAAPVVSTSSGEKPVEAVPAHAPAGQDSEWLPQSIN